MTLAFQDNEPMFSGALDVFRLRQYSNVITRTREIVDGVHEDAGLLVDARRALVDPSVRPATTA